MTGTLTPSRSCIPQVRMAAVYSTLLLLFGEVLSTLGQRTAWNISWDAVHEDRCTYFIITSVELESLLNHALYAPFSSFWLYLPDDWTFGERWMEHGSGLLCTERWPAILESL